MISWLIQSSYEKPVSADGSPDVSFLALEEREQYASLKTEKRRREWLLGRWTSKRLVQLMVQQDWGRHLELCEIIIGNGQDGAPYVTCNGDRETGCDLSHVSLSISHSGDLALCAAVNLSSTTGSTPCLGADIERIEARSSGFVGEYFTKKEAILVEHCHNGFRELLVTAIWSAKEAALKALRLGLRMDTRCLTCLVEPGTHRDQAWIPFLIHWDIPRLTRYGLDRQPIPAMAGWWRTVDGYVLTLASTQNQVPYNLASGNCVRKRDPYRLEVGKIRCQIS